MTKIINFTNVNPISAKENYFINKKISFIIKKKNFILGNEVKQFEHQFSKISKVKYSVGCASGTDALILALSSLNLKKSDEIIVPAMTYISTGLSVILNNKKLVFADINNDTGLISIESVIKKITKKTKVIIPVNLYGQKVDLKSLRKRVGNKINIIEDSAQSHFAFSCYNCSNKSNFLCCKKEKNENFADISCYSFYPSKNLGAYGDGGLVSTNNKKIYLKLLSLRNLGSSKKNVHLFLGRNSRLDTIQAVVLKKKLSSILKLNESRRKIAKIYDSNLSNIKEIKITNTNPGSSRHLYVIRTKERDRLIKYLAKNKVICQIHYSYSLNKLIPFKKNIGRKITMKIAEAWSKECVSLPIYPGLHEKEVFRVIKLIKNYFSSYY